MTQEKLEHANKLKKDIDDIEYVLNSLKCFARSTNEPCIVISDIRHVCEDSTEKIRNGTINRILANLLSVELKQLSKELEEL